MPRDVAKQKIAQHESYLRNKEKVHDRAKESRRQKKLWLEEYKVSKGCRDCGENHVAVLDLHHKDDDKLISLADAKKQKGWAKIKAEVEKCVVLCSNCHRKEHWGMRQTLPSTTG